MKESSKETLKTFKNVEDQIKFLHKTKKINFKYKDKSLLGDRNYISIINPYKEFFAVSKSTNGYKYKTEIDFEQYKNLIACDDAISLRLYELVGGFERKFKNLIFLKIGEYYKEEQSDIYSLRYITDIEDFLERQKESDEKAYTALPPKFSPRFFCSVTENGEYESDSPENIQYKLELFKKIFEISINRNLKFKSNTLIKNYIKKQNACPLWAIPNALTLGEINSLFLTLSSDMKKEIISSLTGRKINKIGLKDIFKFSGRIEDIRIIRNVINHYEPIFPCLFNYGQKIKKYTDLRVFAALKLLKESENLRVKIHPAVKSIDSVSLLNSIPDNTFTHKKIEYLKEILNLLFS